jgi:prepilin-type N-terminal cleavage/methylation domain-containing protein
MKRDGFTLVEVLVALVVAVAAMTLLSQGFMTGARASTSSQAATRAALVAQRALTEFETGQLSASSNQNGSYPDEPDFTFETKSDTGEVTGLTKLTVTVKWKERNQDRKYELVRLLRERPVEGSTTPSTTPAPTTPR